MRVITLRLSIGLSCLALLYAPQAAIATITAFHFTSSPSSYVGAGQTLTVTESDGYLFSAGTGGYRSILFKIYSHNSPYGPDWNPSSGQPYHYWNLYLGAPQGQNLTAGMYEKAKRPLWPDDRPGLNFTGDGRGNNTLSGDFEILEIEYSPIGEIVSFAVNFTQYDERMRDRWIRGELRYNSDVPMSVEIPEPSTICFLICGALVKMRRLALPHT